MTSHSPLVTCLAWAGWHNRTGTYLFWYKQKCSTEGFKKHFTYPFWPTTIHLKRRGKWFQTYIRGLWLTRGGGGVRGVKIFVHLQEFFTNSTIYSINVTKIYIYNKFPNLQSTIFSNNSYLHGNIGFEGKGTHMTNALYVGP